MTFCVTQVTFFVTTKTPPSEGRALHDRQGTPWLDCGISPFGHRLWPDRTNGPRHPTDKCSRTRGAHPSANDIRANQHSVCFSRKATRSGLAPRRVGLCTTAKERPGSIAASPPLATACCSTVSEDPARYDPQANGLGMRPTHPRGRAERIPPQTRPLACFGIVPARQNWFGLAPLGGSGSARPPRNASARPCHVPHLATGSCSTASHGHPPYDRNSRPYGFHRRSSFGHLPLLDLLRMMLFEENPHLDPTQSHSTPCKKKIAPSSQTPIPAR